MPNRNKTGTEADRVLREKREQTSKKANEYISRQLASPIAIPNTLLQKSLRDNEHADSPIFKMAANMAVKMQSLEAQLHSINNNHTITKAKAEQESQALLAKHMSEASAMVETARRGEQALLSSAKGQLYSSKIDESPRVMSLVANATILDEMRQRPYDFTEIPSSAPVLNVFNAYGLIGDAEKTRIISNSLNLAHTPKAVDAVEYRETKLKEVEAMGTSLREASAVMMQDTSSLADFRRMNGDD